MIVADIETGETCGKPAEFSEDVYADPYNEVPQIREKKLLVRYCREHWEMAHLLDALPKEDRIILWFLPDGTNPDDYPRTPRDATWTDRHLGDSSKSQSRKA